MTENILHKIINKKKTRLIELKKKVSIESIKEKIGLSKEILTPTTNT